MVAKRPLVSLGMPVFEAETFLRASLDSLLAQQHSDFELLISDNTSSDTSGEICREYAARDERVRYHRQEENVGAIRNFNWLLDQANSEYFAWTADHDLWDPAWLSRCVAVLQSEPEVVLAQSRTQYIAQDSTPIGLMPDRVDTRGLSALERYVKITRELDLCNIFYGVFRREPLQEATTRRTTVFGGDHLILAEMTLKGEFAHIPEPLFLRRKNRPRETQTQRKERVLDAIDPEHAEKRKGRSYWQQYRELRDAHLEMLAGAGLSFSERLQATVETVRLFNIRFGV